MRKWIICAVAVLLGAAACQKPYVTQMDLAVNNEEILLPSFEEGHCYITVFSNSSWSISIRGAADWAKLDRSGGTGIGYVRLDYQENYSPDEDRNAVVVVSGSGKECQIVVTQPHA